MKKRLGGHWRLWLALGVAMVLVNLTLYVNREALVSYAGMKLVDAQQTEADPDSLALADFQDVPGVTQEYVDAYKIFLKAGDRQSHSYADAATAFEKIAATTENPELKLRSLYLVTFSNFLQFNIDQAYKSGQEVLSLSKQLFSKDSRVAKLDEIVTAITKGEIQDLVGLRTEIVKASVGVGSSVAEELNAVIEGRKGYQELKSKLEAGKAEKK